MITQASFGLRGRNPDVLTCIANLSNDEVFTPPEFANRMLDTLAEAWAANHGGASIWEDRSVTFLDPCTKSGVFLREITSRLTEGLARQMPDLEARVDHILTKQVFGIGITRLTSLLARRSLYCSKFANGKHSVVRSFADDAGNVAFPRVLHTWDGERCRYCGAAKSVFDRPEGLETHAYAFIHGEDVRATLGSLFGGRMQFDVIIGNPPYQLDDGGFGASAAPIYQLFVEQAKQLEPRFLCMVTPARWVAGGKGLDAYREAMLKDRRLRVLHDFLDASDAFPGVDIAGGISYFLWERDSPGDCSVTTTHHGIQVGPVARRLDEFDVFVRHAPSVAILHKIWLDGPKNDRSMASLVSASKPFGLRTYVRGKSTRDPLANPVELASSKASATTREWIEREDVVANHHWIDAWKATIGAAAPAGGRPDKDGRYYGLSSIRVLPPDTVCTESYLVAGAFATKQEAESLDSYLRTKFVRFLISLRAVTQHVTRGSFAFVPLQQWDRQWTDDALFDKYALSAEERAFIDSMVRPMADADD